MRHHTIIQNSKHTVLFPLLLAAGVVLSLVLGQYLGRNTTTSQLKACSAAWRCPTTNSSALSLIENQYVDSVSMDSLAEHVIDAGRRAGPPFDLYPRHDMQVLNEPLEGGSTASAWSSTWPPTRSSLLNVIPQGPSDKAGVKAGDRIVEIGDSLVAGRKIPQNNVVKMLRGPRGTTVRLGLERQGISDLVEVEVVRGVIPIRSIESAFRIADGVGYVKLGQFARTTFDEFRKALASLRAEGVTKLIFDLRGNTGGFLDQAIAVANEFLHEGQLIVYTEDRRHEQLREYADGKGSAQDMEVVVLIDEGSASSSEILAGALQDNDRGTIIGRRSFGKGLVQRQIPYSDGSALRLTTARYYTPTGRSIQKPYTIGDDADYEEDLWNRYRNNEFFSADSIHFADSLKRVTPGGKVVYGGGGIMPDVFIPADTTDVTKYFVEVAGRNILYRYTIEYADRHREALNAVKTIDELQTLLDSDKTLVDDFVRYAARKGVAPRYGDIARSRRLIEAQLRAYIGRNTALEDNGFYANIYPVDNVVVRAIGILKEENEND